MIPDVSNVWLSKEVVVYSRVRKNKNNEGQKMKVMKKGIVLAFGVLALVACESAEEKAFKASIERRISLNEKMIDWCEAKQDSVYPYYLEDISHSNFPTSGAIYNWCNREIDRMKMQIEEDKKFLYK